MTCFSIHNSLRSGLFLALFVTIFGLATACLISPGPALAQSAPANAQQNQKTNASLTEDMLEEARQREKSMVANAPIYIELFTSKDCSACIFADRMLYDAMADKDVIALSCQIHDLGAVSTKEGIGGASANDGPMDPCAFRQWAYKVRHAQLDVVLNIPTFFFNGYGEAGVDNADYFNNMLASYHYLGANKALEVFMQWKDNDTITLNLPQQRLKGEYNSASVWVIRYKDMSVESISEGVNKGRVLRFSNIIQDIRHVGKWHGDARTIEVNVPKPTGGKDRGGYVAVIQEMMGEPVLAVGKLEDYPLPGDPVKKHEARGGSSPAATVTMPGSVPSQERTPVPTQIPVQ